MKKRILAFVLTILLTAAVFAGCSQNQKSIVVGAKDFTEQDVLGNILTLLLENNTDLKVTYKHEMASNVVFAAIQSGDVDVYIDYTGTVYGNYLQHSDIKSADEVYDISAREIKEKFNLLMLEPIGFNNTYCLAVREETAAQYNLKTYSDLAKVSSDLVFSGTFEILNRNDGIPNLKKVYDMSFKDELALDGVLRYSAITKNDTQIIDAFSTDGMLMEYDLVVLEDDKSFFPPYHATPIIREETATKYPELLEVLGKLTGAISDDAMRELNYKVDVLKEDPKAVAEGFLQSQGLLG